MVGGGIERGRERKLQAELGRWQTKHAGGFPWRHTQIDLLSIDHGLFICDLNLIEMG